MSFVTCKVSHVMCHIMFHISHETITQKLLELGTQNFVTMFKPPVCQMSDVPCQMNINCYSLVKCLVSNVATPKKPTHHDGPFDILERKIQGEASFLPPLKSKSTKSLYIFLH